MRSLIPFLLKASVLLLGHASAHTWNEQLSLINSNGEFSGPYGYSRGYVSRTEPGYNGYSMLWLLPPLESGRTRIDDHDLLCHPAQRTQNQTAGWPRLRVAPGSVVAMKYLENGHVTEAYLIPGKPKKAGTAFVYGTTEPKADEKISQVLFWNRAGTGGDGRGRLLAAQNFDDGRCHQISDSPMSLHRQQTDPDPFPGQPGTINEQWCETDLTLPNDLKVGQTYTIYWVWQWPTAPGTVDLPDGKDEYYTTCSDFDVVAKEPTGPITNTLEIQDPQTVAVSDYKSRPALTQVPNLKYEPIGTDRRKYASPTVPMAAADPSTTPSVTPAFPSVYSTVPYPSEPTTSLTSANPAAASSMALVPSYNSISSSSSAPFTVPQPSVSAYSASYTSEPSAPAPLPSTSVVLTAYVTVTATLAPAQTELVVNGNYQITFMNTPSVIPASVVPRSAEVSPPVYTGRYIGRHQIQQM